MIRIHAFAAERPPADQASRIASVPYDVISTREAKVLTGGNPDSFLHVIRPEVDLDEGIDPYSEAVYEAGRSKLDEFRSRGLLVEDDQPGIYLYRLTWRGQSQTGIVCCCDAQQYRDGLVKKHEFTRPDKEDDRTRHLEVSETHAEPVFLAFHDHAGIQELVDRDSSGPADCAFSAEDGVTHECWKVADPEKYIDGFSELEALYIADGHHRSAAAERAARSRMDANPDHHGDEEYNRLLAVCFPAGELRILPYNRVVRDRSGLSSDEFLNEIEKVGRISPAENGTPSGRGEVRFWMNGSWRSLTFHDQLIDHSDPVESLDCALLQSLVLQPMLGIDDPRKDQRIEFVGGIRPESELQDRAGTDGIAFSMHPTSMDELLAVADSGMTMPPKSTWFEPKLRSGLFVHNFCGSRTCAS
ncbi:MAG: hypothetical protein CBC35_06455 [Planctomycetes bacterium TMED75]|nr:hypothetical protein [Planctomycetaceae bacterium]OUU92943.1 MAG: hypothetical protein CBC35_06455 [Planctomycetes bacterium TMED75]